MSESDDHVRIDPDKKEIDDLFYSYEHRWALIDMLKSETISYPYEERSVSHGEDGIDYNLDSLGLRNPHLEKHKQVDTIFLGCSHTWGKSLPSKFVWVKILSDLENTESYVNLAYPGASIYSQMQSLFGYIKEHGEPKRIIAHFPELTRMRIPKIRAKFDTSLDSLAPLTFEDFIWIGDKNLVKYSKRPHMVQEVVPPEVFYYISAQSINMIQNYAESRDITFLWNTWDSKSRHFFDSVKETVPALKGFFANYVQRRPVDEESNSNGELVCPDQSHYDWKEKNPEIFDFAKDGRHAGIHANLHVAELFYEEILKRKSDTK